MVAVANAPVVLVVLPVLPAAGRRAAVLAGVVVPAGLAMIVPIRVRIVPCQLFVVLTMVGPVLVPISVAVLVPISVAVVAAVPGVVPARFAVLLGIATLFAVAAMFGQVTVQVGAMVVLAAVVDQRAVLVIGDIAATGFPQQMAALRRVWTADSVPSPAAGDLTGPLAQGTGMGRVVARPTQTTEAWPELRT